MVSDRKIDLKCQTSKRESIGNSNKFTNNRVLFGVKSKPTLRGFHKISLEIQCRFQTKVNILSANQNQ